MQIPFYDLKAINKKYAEIAHQNLDAILDSGLVLRGEFLADFEDKFAKSCGVKGAVGVASGLDALTLILRAVGIGKGDEVLVPSFTFIATWLAVTHCGATPVPVDVTSRGLLNTEMISNKINARTKAIIPVHLFGQLCDLNEIYRIAESRGLIVIDDAAQAHGAGFKGFIGSKSIASAYSFYPSKNLGALGDGGAITSNDMNLLEKVRKLANYGSSIKYVHDEIGFNSRLEEFHAAFLASKLGDLETDNLLRRSAATYYLNNITNPLINVLTTETLESVFHLFVIRTSERNRLQEYLNKCGIETLVHYPIPPYQSAAYFEDYGSETDCPMSDLLSNEVLSIPLWPGISKPQQNYVTDCLNSFN